MSDINLQHFAKRLKKLRTDLNITQKELAEATGVAPASISYYEKGERLPDIGFIDKLKSTYGVSFDYLLGYADTYQHTQTATETLHLSDDAITAIQERYAPNYVLRDTLNLVLASDAFYDYLFHLAIYATNRAKRRRISVPFADIYDEILTTMDMQEGEKADSDRLAAMGEALYKNYVDPLSKAAPITYIAEHSPSSVDNKALLYKARFLREEGRKLSADEQMHLNAYLKHLREKGFTFTSDADAPAPEGIVDLHMVDADGREY